jgi:hypothetical protein
MFTFPVQALTLPKLNLDLPVIDLLATQRLLP